MKKLLLATILLFNMNSFTNDIDDSDIDNTLEQLFNNPKIVLAFAVTLKVIIKSFGHLYDAAQQNQDVPVQEYLRTFTHNTIEKCSEFHRLMSTIPTDPEFKKLEQKIEQKITPYICKSIINQATKDDRQDVAEFMKNHLPNNK